MPDPEWGDCWANAWMNGVKLKNLSSLNSWAHLIVALGGGPTRATAGASDAAARTAGARAALVACFAEIIHVEGVDVGRAVERYQQPRAHTSCCLCACAARVVMHADNRHGRVEPQTFGRKRRAQVLAVLLDLHLCAHLVTSNMRLTYSQVSTGFRTQAFKCRQLVCGITNKASDAQAQ